MMDKSKKSISGRQILAFLLPTATILAQWFSVAGINLSWMLYILLFLFVFLRYQYLFDHAGLLLVCGLIVALPPVTFVFGIAESFQSSLYFSLITGMMVMLFICLMTAKEYAAFIKGLLFSCILFAVWGIYEVFTGHYILFNNDAFFKNNWVGMHYPGVAFANTNDLVQYLVLLYPVSGYLLLKRNKWLFGLLTVAVVFVTFQAGAKLGMIAICMILLLAFAVSTFLSGKGSRAGKLVLTGACLAIGLWVFDIATGSITQIIDNFLTIDTSADYFTGRDDIYTPLIAHALIHPFGGFGSAYNVTEMNPHNFFLYVLCDYGWLPFLAMLVILVRMGLHALKTANKQGGSGLWCLLFAALCLFVITSSISSCNEQRKAVWMFLAVCVRSAYIAPPEGARPIQPRHFRITWGRG